MTPHNMSSQLLIQDRNPIKVAENISKIHHVIYQPPEQTFTLFSASEKEALLKIHIKDENLVAC